ncbi:hypothetical protein EON64_04795 [archaeon]|nr:MAG: hypothetical protein EON64_04795 [archaeon]
MDELIDELFASCSTLESSELSVSQDDSVLSTRWKKRRLIRQQDRPSDESEVKRIHREAVEKYNERKERRKLQRRKSVVPRILKRDIRRDWSAMFVNTVNCAELERITAFYRFFCRPDCRSVDMIPVAQRVFRFESVGVERLARRTFAEFQAAPDLVVRLLSSAIWQTQNGSSSRVVCRLRVEGTNRESLLSSMLQHTVHGALLPLLSCVTAAHQVLPAGRISLCISMVFHLDSNLSCTSVELLF